MSCDTFRMLLLIFFYFMRCVFRTRDNQIILVKRFNRGSGKSGILGGGGVSSPNSLTDVEPRGPHLILTRCLDWTRGSLFIGRPDPGLKLGPRKSYLILAIFGFFSYEIRSTKKNDFLLEGQNWNIYVFFYSECGPRVLS